jgi:tetratricopeptide (TPR) repeat protein
VRETVQEDTLFADRYRILAPLGEGAMGVVWRVFDEHGGSVRALKILKPELGQSADIDRFRREFRATARLDHPHCIRCFEQGSHGGHAYFTMEYVAGGSLEFRRWDDPAEVVELGLQLLAGLDHIHARGIIHRDLKPQNIFVDREAGRLHARLGDFGIVKVADFHDEGLGVGDVLGSLRFLAPETLEHGTADPRSDLYALGIVLYYLLAGEHPLGDGQAKPRQWLTMHRQGRMRRLERADVPEALVEAIHRMCARRPEARFGSAAAAFDALEAVTSAWPARAAWPRPAALERRPHLAAPAFVGRDPELEQARRFWTDAVEGSAGQCMMFVAGAAGLGKSRLVRELMVEAFDGDALVLAGTCPAEGGSPYLPLRELMRALEDHGQDPLQALQAAQTLTRRPSDPPVDGAAPDDPTVQVQAVDEATPVHRDLSEPSFRPSEALSPEDQALARLRFHERLTSQLFELCSKQPVLIVLDDAQWADPPTLQLLVSMARSVALSRSTGHRWSVGFVVTHRPLTAASSQLEELRAAMGSLTQTSLSLGPLSHTAATALVASMLMLEPQQVPETFATPLLAKAEGSPLFLSQIMQLLLGKGLLVQDERGCWCLDARLLETAGLPASVGLAIGERASRLATPSKHLLAAAAVVGRRFETGTVASIVEEDELTLLDGLDELVRAQFIEDVAGGYRFVHDRIRESVYDNLSETDRITLHHAAALALRERDGTRPDVWPAIAHHFHQARDHALAYRFALRAAEHASNEYAHGAAEEMYALAFDAAAKSDTIQLDSKMWERRGDACSAMARYAMAVDCYQHRLDASPSLVERRVVLSKMGTLEYKRGRFVHAVEAMEKVLGLAGFVPPRSALAAWVRTLGQAALAVLPARPWSGPLEDGDARARSCALMAECWYFAGDQARTFFYSLLSANTARKVGPSPGAIRALAGFGYALTIFGLHRVGGHFVDLARDFSGRIKVPANEACWLEVMTGLNLATRGRPDHALAVFDEASRRFDDSANSEARLLSFINHSLIRLAAGRDLPRVERMCNQMRHLAEETGDTRAMGWGGEARGQLALRRGRLDEGFVALRDAAERCTAANDLAFASSVNDTLALFLALEGEHAEALERGQQAGETVLKAQLRHYVPVDGGLVIAAALAKHRGQPLPPAAETLARRVLRSRGWVVRASRLTELRYELGQQAWRVSRGKSADFMRVIDKAERAGFHGEAWVGHRVAAAFDGPDRSRHLAAMKELQGRFEEG